MSSEPRKTSRRRVVLALALIVALGGLLALRIVPSSGALYASGVLASTRGGAPRPPAANLPEPKSVELASLSIPCWSCYKSEKWPVAFRTDLDLLAPLGDGPGNAAAYFSEFAEPDGRRNGDWVAASARKVDGPSDIGKVLPADDPLLLEAEPWCDQATMRFYPDFFALEGPETRIPNLFVPLTLARSWTARGLSATDSASAMADFRRAIRLGRLIRQDGTTIIADLVGLAMIRIGAQGIYERAVLTGDTKLALTAAVVLGECAPQRLYNSERVTKVDTIPYIRKSASGDVELRLPDQRLAGILEMASSEAEPRFLGEAILSLNLVRFLGAPEQRALASAQLERLAKSADARIATLARWGRDSEPNEEYLESLVHQAGRGSR